MRWCLAIAVSLVFVAHAQAQFVPAEPGALRPVATFYTPDPYSIRVPTIQAHREREDAIKQLAVSIDTLRSRVAQIEATSDQAAKDRRPALDDAIAQLQKHQATAQSELGIVPAAFANLELGAIGRAKVGTARIMQLVDDKSVLVTGIIGGKEAEVVLVRGVKTDGLVDKIELKQMFRVTGKHKYKSAGRELEAPILEPFDAAVFAGK